MGKRSICIASVVVILAMLLSPPLKAQDGGGLIDGVTVGAGFTTFYGEVDNVHGVRPILHTAFSEFHFMAGVDRQFPIARFGLEAHYHSFSGAYELTNEELGVEDELFEVSADMFAFDFTASRELGIVRPHSLRLFVGVGPMYVLPDYDPDDLETAIYNDRDSVELRGERVLFTMPFGLIWEDRLRIGVRLTFTDYLDGVRHEGSPWDSLSMVNFGWRFNLAD